jgi:rRNA maturation RNase YbeY
MPVLCISKTVREEPPELPYEELLSFVLPQRYECSLVFVGDKRSRTLNMAYRGKDYVPNTLSFSLDEHHGEIFINLKEARKQAKKRSESFEFYIALLFVHSCLHLKGMEHSDIMDKKMYTILRKAGIHNSLETIL